jgi:NADP-dependent 3-hydroxy acid dehydrogenase YdfG
MSNPVCAVIGVGPGNGTAIARKFSSEGYKIALLSRNEDYLNGLAHELGDTRGYAYDALDTAAPEKVFGKIKQELGTVDVLVYNAGSGMFGSVDETKLSDFEGAWRINALGLLAAVKAVLPDMRAVGKGTIASSVQPHPLNTGQSLPRLPQPRPRNAPLPSRLRSMWGRRACTSLW